MFDTYFETFLADNDLSKRIHYHLRYQIYCLRTRYENPSNHPDQLEQDSYDQEAVHFIVRSRMTGSWVAAMRLVVGPLCGLPVEHQGRVDKTQLTQLIPAFNTNQNLCAELSRLCVVSRGVLPRSVDNVADPATNMKETASPFSWSLTAGRRQPPWLVLGLLRAARQYSEENGIHYWFFLIAASLAKVVQTQGIVLEPVGPDCEHRGRRRPYLGDIRNGFDDMAIQSPGADKMFHFMPAYRPFSELDDSAELKIAANE
jgi:N-acyl amino acid synthase of PEP-CTERM/exosortase system